MWTRADLKSKAKGTMRRMYWQGLLVCLIAGVMCGEIGVNMNINPVALTNKLEAMSETEIMGIMTASGGIAVIALLIGIFIGYPLLVGKASFFLRSSRGEDEIKELIFPFSCEYKNVVKTMFLKRLFISLWSILFVIPGIVKSYDWYLVEYILSENPSMDARAARELSRDMMYGHKLNVFVLDLSFIGWYFLGYLAFGIGVIFVKPYVETTRSELYRYLRFRAVQNGVTTPENLGGVIETLNI